MLKISLGRTETRGLALADEQAIRVYQGQSCSQRLSGLEHVVETSGTPGRDV